MTESGVARYRRRQRLRTASGVGVVLAVLGAVVLAGRGFGGAPAPAPVAADRPPATVRVSRETLVQTEQVAGTLGYGTPATLVARASTAGTPTNPAAAVTHTITWLPAPGTVVEPGQPVYKVDDQPVVLLAGALPPYRVLADGVTGADVTQLEANLAAFGYGGFTVDTRYTAATAAAVTRWQKRLGVAPTGTVDVGQVAVVSGAVRVTERKTEAGAEATGPVLTYTGTTRVVSVPLEVARQHLVRVGLAATVTLPDGRPVAGTVASVGTVATAPPEQDGGPAQPATVDVVVTIADQAALGTLDAAPVVLDLVVSERAGVLAVPVGALVALAEGGYGVQVVTGSTTRYVAVETGLFADGLVEVSGTGIAEGTVVGVPA